MSASLAFALGARITSPPKPDGAKVDGAASPPPRAPLVQPARFIDKRAETKHEARATSDDALAVVSAAGRRVLTWGSCTLAAADTRTAVAAATSARAVRESAANVAPSTVGHLSAPTAADERIIAEAAKRRQRSQPRARSRTRASRRSKIIVAHGGARSSVMANIRFARRARAARAAAKSNLPELPRRRDVGRVMQSIRHRVQRCYDRGMVPGSVVLDITIAGNSGKVVGSSVSAKSSTAECIERLVERLTFPRFARARATIRYPYSFQ